jgi:hypothetical protein
MRIVLWSLAFAAAVPMLLFAIALGPVLLGILCAVGFGLIVFLIANAFLGLVAAGRAAGTRLTHRGSGS